MLPTVGPLLINAMQAALGDIDFNNRDQARIQYDNMLIDNPSTNHCYYAYMCDL